jgi:protein phosphatase
MYQVRSASLSHIGRKRSRNEDFIAVFEPRDPGELSQSGCLYILADGVGGAAEGERASRYAAEKVLYEYYRLPDTDPTDRLRQLIQEAGRDIYSYAEGVAYPHRVATTLVAAVVWDDTVTVANVGDSRAYLLRSGAVIQITRDHSYLEELIESGLIEKQATEMIGMQNRITRSLGGTRDVLVDIYAAISLDIGDRILLCSDGLTRYAQSSDIDRLASQGELATAVERLVAFANHRGGADNISAILVEVFG